MNDNQKEETLPSPFLNEEIIEVGNSSEEIWIRIPKYVTLSEFRLIQRTSKHITSIAAKELPDLYLEEDDSLYNELVDTFINKLQEVRKDEMDNF